MTRSLLVCLGGAVGSGLRYVLSGLAARWFGAEFPYGTLIVNLAGSFAIVRSSTPRASSACRPTSRSSSRSWTRRSTSTRRSRTSSG